MERVSASELSLERFDEIIDVRSPSEYAEDHLPGAINLPVLDDAERAKVGTIYKQVSIFEARKVGAALVSRNIARHLEGPLANKPGGYRPLVYCWRGGQRSNSMATVLAAVGWPLSILEGGYKAFRNRVIADLREIPESFEYRVLAGLTGSGKTEILHRLAERGEQVLDLEGLANHQGSLLGEPIGGQGVSQKKFETRLWAALSTMSAERPVWTEAESAKIGRVFCPKSLIDKLRGGLRIEVEVAIDERVRYLNARYPRWHADREGLLAKLSWLKKRHGRKELELWRSLAEAEDWSAFVRRLLEVHYDPSYRQALDAAEGEGACLAVSELLDGGCERAATDLIAERYERVRRDA